MSRLTSIKRLAIAALAAAGVIAACRAAQPGEAPPLAPRPDIGPSTDPVPGAPDPLAPPGPPGPTIPTRDAGPVPLTPTNPGPVSQIAPPIYGSSASSAIPMQPDRDAGTVDAGGSDARRPDARRADAGAVDAAPDATIDARPADAGAPPRDGRVPDAREIGLPPPRDATLPLPGDAARPLR